MKLSYFASFMFACLIAVPAMAQNAPPTQVDLKAAYCFSVAKDMLAWTQSTAASAKDSGQTPQSAVAALNDWQSRTDRLRAYVVPRLAVVENTGMVLAMSRGEDDVRQSMHDSQACAVQGGGKDAVEACATRSEAVMRQRSCNHLEFLPL
jgi:hypothetical protein